MFWLHEAMKGSPKWHSPCEVTNLAQIWQPNRISYWAFKDQFCPRPFWVVKATCEFWVKVEIGYPNRISLGMDFMGAAILARILHSISQKFSPMTWELWKPKLIWRQKKRDFFFLILQRMHTPNLPRSAIWSEQCWGQSLPRHFPCTVRWEEGLTLTLLLPQSPILCQKREWSWVPEDCSSSQECACQHIPSGSLTSDSWLPFWEFLHAIDGGVLWMLVLVYSAAIFLSWLSLQKLKVEGGLGIIELHVNHWAFPTGGNAKFSTIIDYLYITVTFIKHHEPMLVKTGKADECTDFVNQHPMIMDQ